MKNKTRFAFYIIASMIAAVLLLDSCSKDNDQGNQTNSKTTAVFNQSKTYGTMTDQDGNIYKTIVIGTQTWMAENLRTTKYRDGSTIPYVTANAAWAALNTGAYCNYKNTTNNDTIATFGRLYNYFAVIDSRNLSPIGWHVPTDAEWTTLITFLGGKDVAGSNLKEIGTTHWSSSNTDADNNSGFTALPGGYRFSGTDGFYSSLGNVGYWWSSSEYSTYSAWSYAMVYSVSNVEKGADFKSWGESVRCIKD